MSSIVLDVSRPRGPRAASAASIPPAPVRHLQRPNLVQALQAAFTRRLTVVVGPSGHGKTTAVADACRSLDRPAAWITLVDPGRAPNEVLGEALAGRTATQLADLVVVVDDHAGALDGPGATTFERAIDELAPSTSVVVLARRRPPLSLSRRRSSLSLAEFGAEELCFSRGEVEDYCNHVWDLDLPGLSLDAIASETAGWPAAVVMVADQVVTDGAAVTEAAIRRVVDEYVLDVVLADVTPRVRRGLEQLVGVDPVDGARCAAATTTDDGEALVADLGAQGLLCDDPGHPSLRRHHPVVRAAVRRHLDVTGGAWREAATRVAEWLASRGLWLDAIRCAVEAGEEPTALRWMDDQLLRVVSADGGRLLREVVARVPVEVLIDHPTVTAMALDAQLLAGDQAGMERVLDRLEDGDGAHEALAVRTRQDLTRLRGDAGVALSSGGLPVAPLREVMVVSDVAFDRALVGRLTDADLLVRRAARTVDQWGLDALPGPAALAQSQIALDRGHHDAALRMAVEVRDRTRVTDDLATWVEAALLVGRCHGAAGDLAAATDVIAAVHARLALVPPGGRLALRVARAEAALCLATGDADAVPRLIPELLGTPAAHLDVEDRLLLARLHHRRGDLARAFALAQTVVGVDAGPRVELEAARLLAAVARARGDVTESRRAHARAAEIARAEGLVVSSVHRERRPAARPGLAPTPPRAPAPTWTSPSSAEGVVLTEREQDVLGLLPSHLSTAELADQLYVSVNTVKSHLKGIYRKLDVGTRRGAIARARDLGLLGGPPDHEPR